MTTVSPELTRNTGGLALSNQPHWGVSSVAGKRCTFFPFGSATGRRFGAGGPIGGPPLGGGPGRARAAGRRPGTRPARRRGPSAADDHSSGRERKKPSSFHGYPPVHQDTQSIPQPTASVLHYFSSRPALLLLKRKRLIRRRRHPEHVEDHRYQHVVAEDADKLDHAGLAEQVAHAREGLIPDAARLIELLDEVVDRALVLGGGFGQAS